MNVQLVSAVIREGVAMIKKVVTVNHEGVSVWSWEVYQGIWGVLTFSDLSWMCIGPDTAYWPRKNTEKQYIYILVVDNIKIHCWIVTPLIIIITETPCLDILQITENEFVLVDNTRPFQHTLLIFSYQSAPMILW